MTRTTASRGGQADTPATALAGIWSALRARVGATVRRRAGGSDSATNTYFRQSLVGRQLPPVNRKEYRSRYRHLPDLAADGVRRPGPQCGFPFAAEQNPVFHSDRMPDIRQT